MLVILELVLVLTQEGQPLAYFGKALGVRGQAMHTYEKELMAVVLSVKKWSPYLMDKHFFIKTDHWALKFLAEEKISNLLQQKWISKLLGYNYTSCIGKAKTTLLMPCQGCMRMQLLLICF